MVLIAKMDALKSVLGPIWTRTICCKSPGDLVQLRAAFPMNRTIFARGLNRLWTHNSVTLFVQANETRQGKMSARTVVRKLYLKIERRKRRLSWTFD